MLGRTDVRALRTRIGLASPAFGDLLRPQLTGAEVVMTARHAALEPWWHTLRRRRSGAGTGAARPLRGAPHRRPGGGDPVLRRAPAGAARPRLRRRARRRPARRAHRRPRPRRPGGPGRPARAMPTPRRGPPHRPGDPPRGGDPARHHPRAPPAGRTRPSTRGPSTRSSPPTTCPTPSGCRCALDRPTRSLVGAGRLSSAAEAGQQPGPGSLDLVSEEPVEGRHPEAARRSGGAW